MQCAAAAQFVPEAEFESVGATLTKRQCSSFCNCQNLAGVGVSPQNRNRADSQRDVCRFLSMIYLNPTYLLREQVTGSPPLAPSAWKFATG
jgi:hypothetical protein